MDRWDEPRSVVSPLVFGYHEPHESYPGILDTLVRACGAVPSVDVYRRAKVSWRENERVHHAREVHSIPGVDGRFARRARCVDRADGEQLTDAVNRWVWEIGYTIYNKGALIPAIDPDLTPIVLEVSRFKINAGALRGAAQLALFRNLFTEGLRDFDARLIVFGGQRDWDESLWTFAETPAKPVTPSRG
jgi:hypothetical protein